MSLIDEKCLIENFIKYWKENNTDKYYDNIDVKESLRKYIFATTGVNPDFRNIKYRNIWEEIKIIIKSLN